MARPRAHRGALPYDATAVGTSLPSAPLRPAPDRLAAGDQAFDPNRHLWVDGEWWSTDGLYRWNGADWAPAAEVIARPAAKRQVVDEPTRDQVGRHTGWPTDDDLEAIAVRKPVTELGYKRSAGPGTSL